MPGKDKAEALARELNRLKEERRPYEADWDKAQQFVSSVILRFREGEAGGEKPYEIPSRITSRPANYLETLVSGICGYAINPNILWQKLGLEDGGLEKRYGVKDWLEEAEGKLYQQYNKGNLYSQMPQFVESAAVFGHGIMLVEEDAVEGRIRCSAMNNRECWLDTNEYDEADTVFREYSMTYETAAAYFGLENLAREIRGQWREDGAKSRRLKILHAVYKNRNGEGQNMTRAFPYVSVYADTAHGHIIREGGYEDFPYAVFWWKRLSGKKYGIGPALMAVRDILLLHKTEESRLQVAQLSARPPMNVPAKMKGYEEIVPDGRNYYQPGGEVISPVNVGANFPITLEVTRDFEERIKDWFHVDFFLMLQQQSRQMTATEVVELQGEKAAVLSTMVTNLNAALRKIVQRSSDILFRREKMPPLPAALQERRSAMRVEFLGVLAQAQRRAHQTQGIMTGIQIMGALASVAQAAPSLMEAFDYIDGGEILKKGFSWSGVSEKVIREEDDVAEIRRARAEAQAAERERQDLAERRKELAQNYTKLNEPVRPGTPLAAMTGGAGNGR
ncbi:MAG: head-tail connector protein [Spirochaetaceae bacterium]|nr:head-tail connector protein [Spirochaetaceae bacterium]